MNLPLIASRMKFLANENAPAILTAVGAVGVVATAYLTGRAAIRADKLIQDEISDFMVHQDDGSQVQATSKDVPFVEKVKLTWKCYIPAVAVAGLTITSIVMANKISSKRLAALALSAGISERALQEYKAKVVEKFGERKAADVREEIAQDRVTAKPVESSQVIVTGTGDVLCYDHSTGRYFTSTVENIKAAANYINHELNNTMYASLSEFYEQVGLPPTSFTDSVGWNHHQQIEVKLSTTMSTDGRPCIEVGFHPIPYSDYAKSAWD